MDGMIWRLEFSGLSVVGPLYVYYFVLNLRTGLPRLLSLLPLFLLHLVIPWRASTVPERAISSFFSLWNTDFKLVLLIWDAGPAADPWAMSCFLRFVAIVSLPLQPAANASANKTTGLQKKLSSKSDVVRGEDESLNASKADSSGLFFRQAITTRLDSFSYGRDIKGDAIMLSEIRTKSVLHLITWLSTSQAWQIVLLRTLLIFIFAAFWLSIYLWRDSLPLPIVCLVHTVLMYLGLMIVIDGLSAVTSSVLGVPLLPSFNMPYLADSLTDFWGRRWNLMVVNLLRVSIHEPMRSLLEKTLGSGPAFKSGNRLLSMLIVFLVSGLMHELIFFYMTQEKPPWQVTMFFLINGVACALEVIVTQRLGLKRWSTCPRVVRRLYTLNFVFWTAVWLFFPPLMNTGVDESSVADLRMLVTWLGLRFV